MARYAAGMPAIGVYFCGREPQLRDLQSHSWIWFCGQRRIGKTSLLSRAAQWLKEEGGFALYSDLATLSPNPGGGELFRCVFRSNQSALAASGLKLSRFNLKHPLDRFPRLVDALLAITNGPIALLLDEAERLLDIESNEPQFLDQLGAELATFKRLRFVLGATQRLSTLSDHNSPHRNFLSRFHWVPVGGLEEVASRILLQGEQSEPWKPPLLEDVIREIVDITGGHPFILQLIGENLIRIVAAGGRITVAAAREAIQTVLRDLNLPLVFKDDFRCLSPDQQCVLRTVCAGDTGTGLTLTQIDASCRLTSASLRNAVQFLAALGYVSLSTDGKVFLAFRFYPDVVPELFTRPDVPSETDDPPIAQLFVRRQGESAELATIDYTLSFPAKAAGITGRKEFSILDFDRLLKTIEPRPEKSGQIESFGAALAQLILPEEVIHALEHLRDHYLVVNHDSSSSSVPWETLRIGTWSPTGGVGLSRNYAPDIGSFGLLDGWFQQRPHRDRLHVLLINDPTGDLTGAERESRWMREFFASDPSIHLEEIPHPGDAADRATRERLLDALRSGRFDAVHFDGHAVFDSGNPSSSGLVCHGHAILTGADLAGITGLPYLAVFNTCRSVRIRLTRELGMVDPPAVGHRSSGSAGLAETFLCAGIPNFVGTHWALSDRVGEYFARAFYAALGQGRSVGNAVAEGRKAVRGKGSVDWLNYIHYGDQDFVLRPARS